MHETSAQGWCTGMTQMDGMGREVGGGFRMGNTCKSMADSCQCMAKTTTISCVTFIKRLFSSSLLSVIRVISSAYLRLLIFLLAILIPACASSSPVFLMMYLHISQTSRVRIYSLDILLSQFESSLLLHVQFWLLLPDLHTDFSGGRSGGLVFPSL